MGVNPELNELQKQVTKQRILEREGGGFGEVTLERTAD